MTTKHSFAKKSRLTFWGVSSGYLFLEIDGSRKVLPNIAFSDGTTRTGRFLNFIREKSYWDTTQKNLPDFNYGNKKVSPSHGSYRRQDLNEWWFNNCHLFK